MSQEQFAVGNRGREESIRRSFLEMDISGKVSKILHVQNLCVFENTRFDMIFLFSLILKLDLRIGP